MTKRESSKRTFEDLAEKLERLNTGGAPEDVVDDAFVDALLKWLGPAEAVSDEAMHYAVTQLRSAMKEDAQVAAIRQEHSSATIEKTFGQVMNEVRTKAGWNVGTVAQKLGSETSLVDRLERDLVPLVQLTVRQWADLLELFHVRLTEFIQLASRTAFAQRLQRELGGAHARSRTDANSAQHGRELAHAIARVFPDLDTSAKAPPAVEQKLVDGLGAELRARQRTDPLTE
jgi:ribosome-binding protein aMBF1 (putative translation factor)